LDIFDKLESLYFDGTGSVSLICFLEPYRLDRILNCIQRNPLKELSVTHVYIEQDHILPLLPLSLKRLVLKNTFLYQVASAPILASLKSVYLESMDLLAYDTYQLSLLPPLLFEHLRSLDVEIQGPQTFQNFHKTLLVSSQHLETLRIGYSGISVDGASAFCSPEFRSESSI
jgi:hypothetical protein